MNRQMFVKVAATALRQRGVPEAEGHAEAIATLMDTFAQVLGETPPAATDPAPPRTAFPAPNPEAIAPVAAPPSRAEEPSLIIPSTTMPDRSERIDPQARQPEAPPVRSLRQPATRMKVEDLSLLIQERAPLNLAFDVPMGDHGVPVRVMFERNVISMHAHDSVRLVYFPPNASQSVRESAEVQHVIHVDDVPVDLPSILKSLKEQAIAAIKPRGPIISVTPPVTSGPVKHSQDTYQPMDQSEDQTRQTEAVFRSIG